MQNIAHLAPAYTFTAKSDEQALVLVLEFIKAKWKDCTLLQLSRITRGIKLRTFSQRKVKKILKAAPEGATADRSFTQKLLKQTEFEHLSLGGTGVWKAVEHLQPFDGAGKKELLAAREKHAKLG